MGIKEININQLFSKRIQENNMFCEKKIALIYEDGCYF